MLLAGRNAGHDAIDLAGNEMNRGARMTVTSRCLTTMDEGATLHGEGVRGLGIETRSGRIVPAIIGFPCFSIHITLTWE